MVETGSQDSYAIKECFKQTFYSAVVFFYSGVCYFSKAAGPNQEHRRCATERVEAVTSLDILYNRFHKISMKTMEASDGVKSCGSVYDCPDGEPGCQTRSVHNLCKES